MPELVVVNNEKSLPILIHELGIDQINYPKSLEQCFKVPSDAKGKKFIATLSGFSRVLKSVMPEWIDYRYTSGEALVNDILKLGKIQTTAAYNIGPEIVNRGLRLAIGFQIVRKHDEVTIYPELMEIRKIIEAESSVVKAAIKGARKGKGEYSQEVEKSAIDLLKAQGVITMTRSHFALIAEFMMKKIIDGDKQASEIMKLVYRDNNQRLLTV